MEILKSDKRKNTILMFTKDDKLIDCQEVMILKDDIDINDSIKKVVDDIKICKLESAKKEIILGQLVKDGNISLTKTYDNRFIKIEI
jgi:hypothetical protein